MKAKYPLLTDIEIPKGMNRESFMSALKVFSEKVDKSFSVPLYVSDQIYVDFGLRPCAPLGEVFHVDVDNMRASVLLPLYKPYLNEDGKSIFGEHNCKISFNCNVNVTSNNIACTEILSAFMMTKLVKDDQVEANNIISEDMKTAYDYITEFYKREFDDNTLPDFSDNRKICLASSEVISTDDDGISYSHDVEAYVNLIDHCINKYIDGNLYECRQHTSLEELIQNELIDPSFDELTVNISKHLIDIYGTKNPDKEILMKVNNSIKNYNSIICEPDSNNDVIILSMKIKFDFSNEPKVLSYLWGLLLYKQGAVFVKNKDNESIGLLTNVSTNKYNIDVSITDSKYANKILKRKNCQLVFNYDDDTLYLANDKRELI